MRRVLRAIGWVGDYQAVAAVVQSEFVRVYLWPAAFAIMTGGAGILGKVPAMWIIMASTVSFAAVSHGLLRFSEYRERKDPQNKVKYLGTHVELDLVQSSGVATIKAAQVQVELLNDASFAMSFILANAETELDGKTPPRVKYPMDSTRMTPGAVMRTIDAPIDMKGRPCVPMRGAMSLVIKYGLPGRERYILNLSGDLYVEIHPSSVVHGVATHWRSS